MGIKEIAAEVSAPKGVAESDKAKRAYSFRVTHGSHEGWFTNHVLNNNQQIERGSIAARCRGGMPYDSFSEADRSFTEALAHVTVSIPEDDRPDWAKDLGKADRELILKLYAEAASHEAFFRRRREAEEDSQSQG